MMTKTFLEKVEMSYNYNKLYKKKTNIEISAVVRLKLKYQACVLDQELSRNLIS